MEIKQLRYFVRVAQLGSFSRASIDLDVAQPALSRQIRKLEAEFDAELFYRTGRGVSLTPQGETLLRHGEAILRQVGEAAAALEMGAAALRGTAAIGLPPTIGRTLSLQLALRVKAEHPALKLRIVEGFSGNVLEWLYAGKIDVGVLYAAPSQRAILAEPVVTEELVLVGPPGCAPPQLRNDQIRARDLGGLPMILPSPMHGLRQRIDALTNDLGLGLDVVLEVDSLFSMVETVRQGLGYTILSRASVRRDVEEGAVRTWPIIEPTPTRTLYVATASQRGQAASGDRVAQLIREEILSLQRLGIWKLASRTAATGAALP